MQQTISYLPHFIAIVIVVGMLKSLLLSTGIVNQVLVGLGFEAVEASDGRMYGFVQVQAVDTWSSPPWYIRNDILKTTCLA